MENARGRGKSIILCNGQTGGVGLLVAGWWFLLLLLLRFNQTARTQFQLGSGEETSESRKHFRNMIDEWPI